MRLNPEEEALLAAGSSARGGYRPDSTTDDDPDVAPTVPGSVSPPVPEIPRGSADEDPA